MHPSPTNDPVLDRLDAWLKHPAVTPPADMAARVRARLREHPPGQEADEIDALFRLDPELSDPHMVARVRRRLAEAGPARPDGLAWFRWATPLAAAATLALAFWSFQGRAPQTTHSQPSTGAPPVAADHEDAQLDQIFALASGLHASADMAKLESVADLAFLFD